MSTGKLLTLHAVDLVRFSMGLPALLLALAGIVWMLRRRLASDWVILAAIAGYVAILPPLRWVLLRYELPLIVLFGLCAGVALERLSSRGRPSAKPAPRTTGSTRIPGSYYFERSSRECARDPAARIPPAGRDYPD